MFNFIFKIDLNLEIFVIYPHDINIPTYYNFFLIRKCFLCAKIKDVPHI